MRACVICDDDQARGGTGADGHDGTKARSREGNDDNGSASGMKGEPQRKYDDGGMCVARPTRSLRGINNCNSTEHDGIYTTETTETRE